MQVEIKTLPPARLAYLRITGPYGSPAISEGWGRFMAWCGARGLLEPRRPMYGISQDNPSITPPAQCRYDCCLIVSDTFKPEGEIGVQVFEGGRYACAPFTGTAAYIHAAWMRVFGEWMPQSGWQAADKAGVELYPEDFVVDPDTGAFRCWLCVPVQPARN